jgi:hypothetical protein
LLISRDVSVHETRFYTVLKIMGECECVEEG